MAPHHVSVRVALAVAVLLSAGCGPRSASPASSASPAPLPREPALSRVQVAVTVPAGLDQAPFDVPRRLTVPTGWKASVYVRASKPRFMATTPGGDLLVSQPSTGSVLLVRRGPDGVGRVSTFVKGLNRPHDIVFADIDGRTWVYIAQADRIVRHPYTAGDKTPRPGETVVDGLPDTSTPELRGQYAHVLKNIAVRGRTLYVSIASTCNACVEDTTSEPQRATIYTYDATGHNANRRLLARGLRNAEGLAFVPGTADLWVVVNNRDNLLVPDDRDVDADGTGDRGRRLTAYVDDHPPEEFLKVADGAFYGWPFCDPNIDKGMRNMPYDNDYELNRDGKAVDCRMATPVNVGIQAHSAPLGLTFTQNTAAPALGAVIALHGSWNRSEPTGYKVIHFPWSSAGPAEQRDLATGWLDETTGEAWGRPVDIAIDVDGSLLVSDDAGGSIVRLTPPHP